ESKRATPPSALTTASECVVGKRTRDKHFRLWITSRRWSTISPTTVASRRSAAHSRDWNTHGRRSPFLAALSRRLQRRAHAATVQYLDPAPRARERRRRIPAARAQPLRAPVGEGALSRSHHRA